jgi:NADH-quinone oxidoreductase subunit I
VSYDPSADVIEVVRRPSPNPVQTIYRTFGETLRGLKTTFMRIPEGTATIQYPE